MVSGVCARSSFRIQGRSLLVFVLAPKPPYGSWLKELDAWLIRSKGFFAGRPIVFDLSHQHPTHSEFQALIGELRTREIAVIGVEGIDADWLGQGLVPVAGTGQSWMAQATGEPADQPTVPAKTPSPQATKAPEISDAPEAIEVPRRPKPASLLLESPVRSGQSIVFPEGDVTVIGSLASGAEIVAGGSIHVYGTLRGRAIAGAAGDKGARIFCNRLDAELMAIAGLYKTADEMGAHLRGSPAQARHDRGALLVTTLS
ncbi:MAG: septum site-determining protein MinC [Alphaproteobacteria bacterium]